MGTLVSSLIRNPSVDTARGVATMTDTGDHILLQCELTSAANVTAAGGTVTGSPTFDADGYTPVDASNYIQWTDLTGYEALDYAGQVVLELTTQNVATFDSDTTAVSGSNGSDISTGMYLWSTKYGTGAGTNAAYLNILAANPQLLNIKIDTTSDTAAAGGITSVGKSSTVTICSWWKGGKCGVIVDGVPQLFGNRTAFRDALFHIFRPGAGFSLSSQLFTGRIKSVVISRIPPTFYTVSSVRHVGVFGDSFASQFADGKTAGSNPRFDNTAGIQMMKRLYSKGRKVRVTNAGVSGATICDTGSNDLSSTIAAFAAYKVDVAVILAGQNDIVSTTASDEQFNHATTGTEANLKGFIEQIMFDDYPTNTVRSRTQKVIVNTPASLYQDSTLNTVTNNSRRETLDTLVKTLPAWWVSEGYGTADEVEVYDLFTSMGGDATVNYNYQGQYNLAGNGANTPSLNDRHLSTEGHKKLGEDLFNAIFE